MNRSMDASPRSNTLAPVSDWPTCVWYVACWSHELQETSFLACTTAGEAMVIYKTSTGQVVALEDRCAHRATPLSSGRREGDDIRCMYHGFRFGSDGRCNHIPIRQGIPSQACVRSFPTALVDGWVWVWIGDPATADTSLIPRTSGVEDQATIVRTGSLSYAVDFQLLNDNLLDLSHLGFVHPSTLGAGAVQQWSETRPAVQRLERGIRVQRWLRRRSASFYMSHLGGELDMWSSCDFLAPGIFHLTTAWHRAETADACDGNEPTAEPLYLRIDKQAVTPVSRGSLRYLFAVLLRRSDVSNETADKVFELTARAFEEDQSILEAQQRNLMRYGTVSMVLSAADAAPVQFRRLMRELCP